MIIPALPQTLIPLMAFIAWFGVEWLHHSTLKPWVNALIALLIPVFIALLWAAFSGAFTRNLWGDIGLIVILAYAVMALPDLASWRQWLQDTLTSPFAYWPMPTVQVTPYMPPRGIELPATPAPASSRVSRIPFDASLKPMPPVLPTGPVQTVTPPPEAMSVEEETAPTEQS